MTAQLRADAATGRLRTAAVKSFVSNYMQADEPMGSTLVATRAAVLLMRLTGASWQPTDLLQPAAAALHARAGAYGPVYRELNHFVRHCA